MRPPQHFLNSTLISARKKMEPSIQKIFKRAIVAMPPFPPNELR